MVPPAPTKYPPSSAALPRRRPPSRDNAMSADCDAAGRMAPPSGGGEDRLHGSRRLRHSASLAVGNVARSELSAQRGGCGEASSQVPQAPKMKGGAYARYGELARCCHALLHRASPAR